MCACTWFGETHRSISTRARLIAGACGPYCGIVAALSVPLQKICTAGAVLPVARSVFPGGVGRPLRSISRCAWCRPCDAYGMACSRLEQAFGGALYVTARRCSVHLTPRRVSSVFFFFRSFLFLVFFSSSSSCSCSCSFFFFFFQVPLLVLVLLVLFVLP